ncbi:probable SCO2-Protein involved in stability of Cox1p and Cox2p [Fusarium mangiferae]|uniref:Probable SCO2-Protein involved in stability of Cox1p and Cox2p n=1 Tax=Fusarium mangiferae TaxID=192010 RepID=A0A1L7TGW9_FUSMA|nr:putative SCO2-Protein involved in stability of Cox1p and Cox2p [Fusarium mangiferae]CVK97948.1 probable SCO2-Protein involved in stability of Cox1p and Cox2p [Fusarium mangiferae]
MTTSTFKPTFSLLNHRGAVVTETDFHGKYTLVFFGFTNCKVVCPRAIERLKSVLDDLGPETSERINVVYISVDSERDTPSTLSNFLDKKGASNFIGLTGTRKQLESVRQAFHVFARHKTDNSVPEGYAISHTALTFILGPDGQVVDNLNDNLDKKEVIKRLQKALSAHFDAKVSAQYRSVLDQDSTMVESHGKMGKKQLASIRHIGNLARQLKGDWSNMMGRMDLNDGFGAYRFQLAYSFYALALAHFHRLPAAPVDAFGWVAALAAETGDEEVLHGMLAYADKHFSPVIVNGGLLYPRRDDMLDENGHYVQNTPMQGKAILPLARLNVSKGFQRLYENPWGPNNRHYSEPALDEVGQTVDVYRAVFLPKENILRFDIAIFEPGANGKVELIRVFNRGDWALYCDTRKIAWGDRAQLIGSEPFVEVNRNNGNLVISISDTEILSFQIQWSALH